MDSQESTGEKVSIEKEQTKDLHRQVQRIAKEKQFDAARTLHEWRVREQAEAILAHDPTINLNTLGDVYVSVHEEFVVLRVVGESISLTADEADQLGLALIKHATRARRK
jgi:hypothetical protein